MYIGFLFFIYKDFLKLNLISAFKSSTYYIIMAYETDEHFIDAMIDSFDRDLDHLLGNNYLANALLQFAMTYQAKWGDSTCAWWQRNHGYKVGETENEHFIDAMIDSFDRELDHLLGNNYLANALLQFAMTYQAK